MLSAQERVDVGVLGPVTSGVRRADKQRGREEAQAEGTACPELQGAGGRRGRSKMGWRSRGAQPQQGWDPGWGGVKEAWQSWTCPSEVIRQGYHLPSRLPKAAASLPIIP